MNNKSVFLIIFIFFSIYSFGQDAYNLSLNDTKEIDTLLDNFMKEYNVPALNVAIIKDGKINFINKGTYSRNTDRKVDEHSIFQLASVSKPITAIIINSLLLQGDLKIDDLIIKYFPKDYAEKTIKKLSGITIRDVLHHRSGLSGDSRILIKKRKGNAAFRYDYTEEDFRTDLKKMRLKSKPGETYRYSNFGYALLGYIAERITKQSFEQLIQKYVAQPYQMSQTSSTIINQENLVTSYQKDKRYKEAEPWKMGKLVPPSGIFSTTADLSKLALLQLEAYQREQKKPIFLTYDQRPARKGSGTTYGYGFRKYGNSGTYGHSGEMDGYAADYSIHPELQRGIIVLSSCSGDELAYLAYKIASIVYK